MKAHFDALYGEYKDRVYTIARRYLGNREEALDASQDVFVKLYEKAAGVPGGAEQAPYVFRMVINRCIDLIRKRKATAPLDGLASSEDQAARAEERDEVDFLLSWLNPDQRLAVVLKEMMDLTISEISGLTETDEGTIKSRLSRAKEIMREKGTENGK